MNIEEFLTHIYKAVSERSKYHEKEGIVDEMEQGTCISDVNYLAKKARVSCSFGNYLRNDFRYNVHITDVIFYMQTPLIYGEGVIAPEKLINPIINCYSDSIILNLIKEELLLDEIYEEKYGVFKHYQIVGQNIILHIISRDEPIITIVPTTNS